MEDLRSDGTVVHLTPSPALCKRRTAFKNSSRRQRMWTRDNFEKKKRGTAIPQLEFISRRGLSYGIYVQKLPGVGPQFRDRNPQRRNARDSYLRAKEEKKGRGNQMGEESFVPATVPGTARLAGMYTAGIHELKF